MAEEVYVGIDVSKAELVMAVRPSGERARLANNASGIKQLVARLGELQPRLVVVEATGGLQRQVVAALWAAQIAVAVVNPAWVRHFAKGRGLRGARPTASMRTCWHCMPSANGPSHGRRRMRRPQLCRRW